MLHSFTYVAGKAFFTKKAPLWEVTTTGMGLLGERPAALPPNEWHWASGGLVFRLMLGLKTNAHAGAED